MGLRVVTVTKSHYLAAHPGQGRATTYIACATVIPAGTNLTPKTATHWSHIANILGLPYLPRVLPPMALTQTGDKITQQRAEVRFQQTLVSGS